jgi:hypothetical protein
MFITDKPYSEPGLCALTMRNEDPEGFVQGPDSQPGLVYVSGSAVRELLVAFGHTTKEDHAEALDKLATVTAENAQLRAELEDARGILSAIDTLESEGFRTRKRPGPKVGV